MVAGESEFGSRRQPRSDPAQSVRLLITSTIRWLSIFRFKTDSRNRIMPQPAGNPTRNANSPKFLVPV